MFRGTFKTKGIKGFYLTPKNLTRTTSETLGSKVFFFFFSLLDVTTTSLVDKPRSSLVLADMNQRKRREEVKRERQK